MYPSRFYSLFPKRSSHVICDSHVTLAWETSGSSTDNLFETPLESLLLFYLTIFIWSMNFKHFASQNSYLFMSGWQVFNDKTKRQWRWGVHSTTCLRRTQSSVNSNAATCPLNSWVPSHLVSLYSGRCLPEYHTQLYTIHYILCYILHTSSTTPQGKHLIKAELQETYRSEGQAQNILECLILSKTLFGKVLSLFSFKCFSLLFKNAYLIQLLKVTIYIFKMKSFTWFSTL